MSANEYSTGLWGNGYASFVASDWWACQGIGCPRSDAHLDEMFAPWPGVGKLRLAFRVAKELWLRQSLGDLCPAALR